MKQVSIRNIVIPSRSRSGNYPTGSTVIPGGGGSNATIDLSKYMKLALWLENFEAKTDTDGNQYIYAKKPLVSVGGFIAYCSDEAHVPSIFEGIPIDNDTIYWDESTGVRILKAKGGGGGSDFDATAMWTALSAATNEQINKSHLTDAFNGYATESWVEGKGYALQKSLDAVSTKLNDFLEGSDTDTIINKWKELEAFLSGMQETDNLAEILSNKADTTYVNSELSKYVTLATEQTIDGLKHFTNGLTIGATKHKIYEKDGNILIEGNVLVTGGITAYSDGSSSGGSGGGGIDVNVLWEILGGTGTQQINKTHLTNALSGYATESWVTSQNYLTSVNWSQIQNKPTTLGGYGITDAYTKTDSDNRFVNVSGDTMTGALRMGSNDLIFNASDSGDIIFQDATGTQRGRIYSGNNILYLMPTSVNGTNAGLAITNTALTFKDNKVWHAGNDGHGSGLDADLLDGYHLNNIQTGGWIGLTSYSYDSTNGTRYYWYKVAILGSSDGIWQIEVDARGDANYAKGTRCIISFSVYNGGESKHIAILSQTSVSDDVIECCMDTQGNVFMRARNVQWISYFRYRLTYGSFGVIASSPTSTLLPSSQKPANTSNIISIGGISLRSGSFSYNNTANLYGNSSTATKLQTARTIWGQSFDGTGNVSGDMTGVGSISMVGALNGFGGQFRFGSSNPDDSTYGKYHRLDLGYHGIDHCDFYEGLFNFYNNGGGTLYAKIGTINYFNGNVGVGTTSPAYKLDVNGDLIASSWIRTRGQTGWYSETYGGGIWMTEGNYVRVYNNKAFLVENTNHYAFNSRGGYYSNWNNSFELNDTNTLNYTLATFNKENTTVNHGTVQPQLVWGNQVSGYGYVTRYSISSVRPSNDGWGRMRLAVGNSDGGDRIGCYLDIDGDGIVTVGGNFLATGGITCYSSDQRAKTVIEQINLSLKQIANAPTIRFKWNNWKIKDDGKTHIGGIAQYMQKLLPETVLEADGVLNLDYSTTGYIFAVQTARHLQTYETRTDRKIRKLEKEVLYLKNQLKKLGYEEVDIVSD